MSATTPATASRILHSFDLPFIFIFFILLNPFQIPHANGSPTAEETMEPLLIQPGKQGMMDFILHDSRRKLNGFKICALCTCCNSGGGGGGGGGGKYCLPSPCCYAINCNIPNRPFGFCAFTPKTCNCFGCHL